MVRDHQKGSMQQDRPPRSSCCTHARPSCIPAAVKRCSGRYSRDREHCHWRGGVYSKKKIRGSSKSASVVRRGQTFQGGAGGIGDCDERWNAWEAHWRRIFTIDGNDAVDDIRRIRRHGKSSEEVHDAKLDRGQKALHVCTQTQAWCNKWRIVLLIVHSPSISPGPLSPCSWARFAFDNFRRVRNDSSPMLTQRRR